MKMDLKLKKVVNFLKQNNIEFEFLNYTNGENVSKFNENEKYKLWNAKTIALISIRVESESE